MSLFHDGETYESYADNPSSLEGRLLFAVPKSESTSGNFSICELTKTIRGSIVASGTKPPGRRRYPIQTRIETRYRTCQEPSHRPHISTRSRYPYFRWRRSSQSWYYWT